jgi:hypothetical protein
MAHQKSEKKTISYAFKHHAPPTDAKACLRGARGHDIKLDE